MSGIGHSLEEAVSQHDRVSEVQRSLAEVKKRVEELQGEVSSRRAFASVQGEWASCRFYVKTFLTWISLNCRLDWIWFNINPGHR